MKLNKVLNQSQGSIQLNIENEKALISNALIDEPLTLKDLKKVVSYSDEQGKDTRKSYRKEIAFKLELSPIQLKDISEGKEVDLTNEQKKNCSRVNTFGNLKSLDCFGFYTQSQGNKGIADHHYFFFTPKSTGKEKVSSKVE